MANQIMVIAPYWLESSQAWVFDDESTDLVQEPFVSGIPEIIEHATRNIPNARKGFRLLFSSGSFPGHQHKLVRMHMEDGGWWYRDRQTFMRGWLCPALFRYFTEAPEHIYVKVEPLEVTS